MNKFFMKSITMLSIIVFGLLSSDLYAKKSYQQKSIYQGYGKVSKVTGKIKTKSVKGHFKPSNGYKYVNSYSKSR